MRIVFMGTPDFAIPTLKRLVDAGYEVAGVVTAPDRPAGRGQKLRPSPVKAYADEQGLTVLQPDKLKNPEFLKELEALKADLAVVVAFRMLPKVVWSMPAKGTINLHAALLPDYRGAAPINWVIINGETETGATTFFIDEKIDTGATLLQTRVPIPEDWTAGDLHDELMEKGADLVLETVKGIEAGTLEASPQDHKAFQHPAPKIFREDCRINWELPASEVYNFIRGLSPYPGAWTHMEDKTLKVFLARPTNIPAVKPGRVHVKDDTLLVDCADEALEITRLQLEGKKRMDTPVFMRGYKEQLPNELE